MTNSGRRIIEGGGEELPREMKVSYLIDIGFPAEVLKANLKLE
jgi:hypothetical protein